MSSSFRDVVSDEADFLIPPQAPEDARAVLPATPPQSTLPHTRTLSHSRCTTDEMPPSLKNLINGTPSTTTQGGPPPMTNPVPPGTERDEEMRESGAQSDADQENQA